MTKSHLDQVMFTIGLVFMAVAATDYVMGSQQQIITLPPGCRDALMSWGSPLAAIVFL